MLFRKRRDKQAVTGRRPRANEGRAPVYSYRSVRDERSTEDRKLSTLPPARSTRRTAQLIIRRVTLALCALVLIYGLWLKTTPQVTIISLPGTIHRAEADYQAEINRIWAKSIMNHTKLTIRADALSREMSTAFPELADVRVELPLIGQLPNVILTPGKPVVLLVTGKGAFYVADNGVTMIRSDKITTDKDVTSLPAIRDESGLVPEPGKPALPIDQMKTIITLLELCAASELAIDSVILPPVPNEVDIVVTGTVYSVKFALDQDPRQGIGALLALRDKFATESIKPSAYVDLRVPDKAFYR